MSLEERFEKMKVIRDEIFHLKDSPLYQYRVDNHFFPVVGEGSHVAHIMFVGEAPGKNEAETARPHAPRHCRSPCSGRAGRSAGGGRPRGRRRARAAVAPAPRAA